VIYLRLFVLHMFKFQYVC